VFPWKLNFPVDEKILENMKRVQMFLNAQKGYPNRAVMIRGQYRISHIIQLWSYFQCFRTAIILLRRSNECLRLLNSLGGSIYYGWISATANCHLFLAHFAPDSFCHKNIPWKYKLLSAKRQWCLIILLLSAADYKREINLRNLNWIPRKMAVLLCSIKLVSGTRLCAYCALHGLVE
jgi:hypothetical protein